VIFNLNTQKSQEIALAVSAQALLDRRLDPDQWHTLIADLTYVYLG
jgi:hypothetical protein